MEKISIIIATYSKERLGYLLECIQSLQKQSLKPTEIILVLDPNPDLVAFYKSKVPDDVTIVVSQRRGLSHARNTGVKTAKGEFLVFIDDDAIADPNWLETLVQNYDNPTVVGVGGRIKPLWSVRSPRWFPEELNWVVGCSYKGLPEYKTTVRNPIGCNMSFRRTVFEKVGYFRTDIGRFGKHLLASEETDFSLRTLDHLSKSRIVYDPFAIVYHHVDKSRTNIKYLWRRSFYEGVSKALIRASHTSSSPLDVEDRYLKYLFKVAIPSRLKRIYKLEKLTQLTVILFSLLAVFLGFSFGRLGRC